MNKNVVTPFKYAELLNCSKINIGNKDITDIFPRRNCDIQF